MTARQAAATAPFLPFRATAPRVFSIPRPVSSFDGDNRAISGYHALQEVGMSKVRLLMAAFFLLAAAAAFCAPQQMSVTVKETQVRATPTYLGKILGTLVYADRVSVLDQPNAPKGWLKVKGPDGKLQGWVNVSSLTEKEIVLKAGSEQVSQKTSTGDVALAGKGFNSDVEAQYKEQEKLDYTWVDTMEKYGATPEQIAAFITTGGLVEQGGAE
jgi:hypothetical protein